MKSSQKSSSETNGRQQEQCAFKRVCYLRMEPQDSADLLPLLQVDGTLCTHLILSAAKVSSRGELILSCDTNQAYLAQVDSLRRRFTHLKVLISVGNHEDGLSRLTSGEQNQMQSSAELRLIFAKSAMQFLQRFHLDGLDIDWKFPNYPSSILVSREHERQGLTKLLTALRSAIVEDYYARQTSATATASKPTSHDYQHQQRQQQVEAHLLTASIAGQEAVLRSSYELRPMANLCDWLNVLAFDYFLFKPYAPFTGPNAPLHSIVEPYVPVLSKLSLSWTIAKLVHEEALPCDKLVIGIPTYARAYRLMFRQTSPPSAFTLALGYAQRSVVANAATEENKGLNYAEVLELLAQPDTQVEFDERAQVPYLLSSAGSTWVSYENERSVRAKVHYIMEQNLAGYMTWTLNSDAHRIVLIDGAQSRAPNEAANVQLHDFPLHRAMHEEMVAFFRGDQTNSVGV